VATSYLRTTDPSRAAQRAHQRLTAGTRQNGGRGRGNAAIGTVLVLLAAVGVVLGLFSSSKATLTASSTGLAKIGMPLGGGTIERITVLDTRTASLIPTEVRGDPTIWPTKNIPAHVKVEVEVTIKRPGWISWLSGSTEHLKMMITAPSASLRSHFITVKKGTPLTLHFKKPVATFAYGAPGHMTHKTFATPRSTVTVPTTATAGTIDVNATLHTWESAKNAAVSYFPAGGSATAVASPAPGGQIKPDTKITLTFSKPVTKVLGGHLPVVSPAGSGSWKTLSTHAIEFVPSGYGYGLGSDVQIALPSGVHLVGGSASGGAAAGSWTVPNGSTLRLQELLAQLGYLPFKFTADTTVPNTPEAQEEAAVNAPEGTFDWAYSNVPSALRSMWTPGTYGTMTEGAIMAFENNNDIDPDGSAGATPLVWKTLLTDVASGKGGTSFGYTFVQVHEADSGESESTWHSGKTVVSGAVNTGTAAAGGTAEGVFPVFEHAPSVTMSGVNPDGSHYTDPGILWVSYFNGGDALHEYPRGSYGFPQSDGCVEMPDSEAASVYPYTPIGTLVDVS
jgi:hypothetical protein